MSGEYVARGADRKVSFMLLPGFALTSFSLAIEALSVVNQLAERRFYDYTLCGVTKDSDSMSVTSSNGVPVQIDQHFSASGPCDIMVICAHQGAAQYDDERLKALIRNQNRRAGLIVALSNGSLILARAGVLTSNGCTLVGDDMAVFEELYPEIPIRQQLYTVDRNVLTCAGGMTALDLFLYIIGRDLGADMASRVSHKFLQDRIRSPDEMQHTRRLLELRMKSPLLGAAIERMEANLEKPLSIQALAREVGTTTRTLEQVFQRFEGTTPARYYLDFRLDCARQMVQSSNLPLLTIGYATGFSSPSYFSRCFRERFGSQPRAARRS